MKPEATPNSENYISLPFRNHIRKLPGETLGEHAYIGVLPTPATTTLLSPIERVIVQNNGLLSEVEQRRLILPATDVEQGKYQVGIYESVGNYFFGETERQRAVGKKTLQEVAEDDFPKGYDALADFFRLQIENGTSLRGLESLRGTLGVEIAPPQNTQARITFVEHTLSDRSDKSEFDNHVKKLIATYKDIFDQNSLNIIMFENASTSSKLTQRFLDGFRISGSFALTAVYLAAYDEYLREYGKPPTKDTLKDLRIKNKVDDVRARSAEGIKKKQYARYLALDELIKENYTFQPEFERARPGSTSLEKHASDLKAATSEQETTEIMKAYAREDIEERNGLIAVQITQILSRANTQHLPVRFYAEFGSLHAGMKDLFPSHLRRVLQVDIKGQKAFETYNRWKQ